jgi:hypothetical protein
LAAAVSLVSEDGLITLDRDIFLDAIVHPVGGTDGAFVSGITRVKNVVTLTVGDPDDPPRCAVSWKVEAARTPLKLNDRHDRAAGLIVCRPLRLAAARTWPEGTHTLAFP